MARHRQGGALGTRAVRVCLVGGCVREGMHLLLDRIVWVPGASSSQGDEGSVADELPLILVGGSGRAVVVTACKGDGHYSFYSLLAVNPE